MLEENQILRRRLGLQTESSVHDAVAYVPGDDQRSKSMRTAAVESLDERELERIDRSSPSGSGTSTDY